MSHPRRARSSDVTTEVGNIAGPWQNHVLEGPDGAVTAQADGAEALRQMAEQATAMFTTRRQSMKDFAVDGEQAVIRVDFEGVLACDLPNGMRAGQRIAVQGRSEFTFRDDRLVRIVDIS